MKNAPPEQHAQRDDWDDHWSRYAEAAQRNPAQRMRYALVTKLITDASDDRESARIIDFGSGQGDLLQLLKSLLPGAQLVGFEMSGKGVEISRKKVPAASFHVVDIFTPPAEAKNYENWATGAICSEVLEHLDSPEIFLKRLRAYLKENAVIIVTVPGGPMSAFDRHIGHRKHFNHDSLAELLESTGFKVERVYRSGFPFFNLYRLVVIARGGSLISDVRAENHGATSLLARLVMAIFRGLFRLNFINSRWGWQMIAIAHKRND